MDTIKNTDRYILNTYKRFPVVFKRGKGVFLYDEKGEEYLDMGSGIAVSCLGHSHPRVVKAIRKQAGKLLHTSNLYYSMPAARLAEKLVKMTGYGKVFFCNSGAEANEAALKLARKHGKLSGNEKKVKIISMNHSFHGRTLGTVTVTAQEKYQKPFLPLLPGVEYVEYNDIVSLEGRMDEDVCAVILEPVQGEGGVHPATLEFLKRVRELCDKYCALLIFDEVQTGVGRTGTLFCYEQCDGVRPDLFTAAKGIAAGLPMGALFVDKSLAEVLQPGDHASTFGGNPVVASAALAVLETIEKEKILLHVRKQSSYFLERLKKLQQKYPSMIGDVRGKGFLIGMEVRFPASELVELLLKRKIITIPAGANVVRFLPPLIVKKKEIDVTVDTLEQILKKRI